MNSKNPSATSSRKTLAAIETQGLHSFIKKQVSCSNYGLFCSNCKQNRKWKENIPEFANERAANEIEHVEESEDDTEDVAVEGKYCGWSSAAFSSLVGGSNGRSRRCVSCRRREDWLRFSHCFWRWLSSQPPPRLWRERQLFEGSGFRSGTTPRHLLSTPATYRLQPF